MNLFFTRPDRYAHLGFFPLPAVERLLIGGAPGFLHGLKLLFVSDVHLRPGVSEARLQALAALLAGQKADMLLLGGDYAESPADCLRFFRALKDLHFPLGIFAVPGNNDIDSMPGLSDTLRKAGGTLLVNQSRSLDLPSGRILLAGCDDHKYGSPCTRNIFGGDEGAYRIFLSHYPVMPEDACHLMLSGHTHAGQFNLLGVTPYSIGFERSHRLLGVHGLRRIGDMQLLVGSGIGVSRLPLRIGARPRIYLLEFGA